ncbi:MvaI/BcnI family restriction endonuclease [Halorubrum sp. Eb13]|uniref:MvaI/BcnI family restriction endonuclease n=1 Tax=Halorubrum sp. Eb13 TaxID=1383843 RepID=UPI0015957F03|nr:MvaI/BcnI family restriction endonuclease [Halorubrum sp. Eb13]
MPHVPYDEFLSRLKSIKRLGYVKTLRSGNTGIGKSLEDLLGIEENNNSAPDIANVELKSHRADSSSLITISTKAPQKANRRLWGDALAQKYGYENSSGKQSARTTLKLDVPSKKTGLYLSLDDFDKGNLRICHEEDGVIATYTPLEIEDWVQKAQNGLVLVEADVLNNLDTEYFWYESATRYSGWNKHAFEKLIRTEKLRIDIRIRVGKNNGTAIRAKDKSVLNELYQNSESLLTDVTLSSSPSPVDPPFDMDWGTIEDVDNIRSALGEQQTFEDFN